MATLVPYRCTQPLSWHTGSKQRGTTLFLLCPLCGYSFYFDLACLFLILHAFTFYFQTARKNPQMEMQLALAATPAFSGQTLSCRMSFTCWNHQEFCVASLEFWFLVSKAKSIKVPTTCHILSESLPVLVRTSLLLPKCFVFTPV